MCKREKIKDFIQKDNFFKAMQVASSLRADKEENDLKIIQQAYSYMSNPSFYSFIDIDKRNDLIDNAIFLLKSKFI